MTVKEYFNAWEGFDFYYQMSDDHRWYIEGREAVTTLSQLANGDPVLEEICQKFCTYNNTLGSSPKPKLEDYL